MIGKVSISYWSTNLTVITYTINFSYFGTHDCVRNDLRGYASFPADTQKNMAGQSKRRGVLVAYEEIAQRKRQGRTGYVDSCK